MKPGSLLFVQTTAPLKKLPRLCSKFRCFTRDSVWTDRSDEVSLVMYGHQTVWPDNVWQGLLISCVCYPAVMSTDAPTLSYLHPALQKIHKKHSADSGW